MLKFSKTICADTPWVSLAVSFTEWLSMTSMNDGNTASFRKYSNISICKESEH